MKRAINCLIVFCLIFSIFVVPCYGAETTNDPAALNGCRGVDGAKPYLGNSNLIENVQSAFLYEVNTDSVMYVSNGDLPQYPASLVKIMTALLVLENASLDSTVTVTQEALDSVSSDAISANLLAGEQMTVENLMYCLIVKSANDAAAVLAEYISGSQEAFVTQMNARAAELGCTGTNYVNPHGLHHPDQVTTAKDTCRVLLEALKHDQFRTFFGTVRYTVPATNLSEERLISTNNFLTNSEDVAIYLDTRVTGGRTGVTSEGFRNIASIAQSGSMEVICIVMGCKSTMLENSSKVDIYGGFPETTQLLNYAFEGNTVRQIIFRDQIIRQQSVLNGDNDLFIAAKEDVFAVLPEHYTLDDLSMQYHEASDMTQAPILEGQNLGTLQVMYGDACIAQTELYAAGNVAVAASKTGNYIEPARNGFSWWIILLIPVLGAALFYGIRIARFKKRGNHNRENNRRRRF